MYCVKYTSIENSTPTYLSSLPTPTIPIEFKISGTPIPTVRTPLSTLPYSPPRYASNAGYQEHLYLQYVPYFTFYFTVPHDTYRMQDIRNTYSYSMYPTLLSTLLSPTLRIECRISVQPLPTICTLLYFLLYCPPPSVSIAG